MTNTPSIISAAVVPLAGFTGAKLGSFIADVVPTSGPFEGLLASLIGPFGFLVGTLIAIRWLVGQLTESRKETIEHIRVLAELSASCRTVIEQNSEVIESIRQDIQKCKGRQP
jgi:hypothetical protein